MGTGIRRAPIMHLRVQSPQGPLMPHIVPLRAARRLQSRHGWRRQAGSIKGAVVLALVLVGLVASLVVGFGLFGIVLRLFMR